MTSRFDKLLWETAVKNDLVDRRVVESAKGEVGEKVSKRLFGWLKNKWNKGWTHGQKTMRHPEGGPAKVEFGAVDPKTGTPTGSRATATGSTPEKIEIKKPVKQTSHGSMEGEGPGFTKSKVPGYDVDAPVKALPTGELGKGELKGLPKHFYDNRIKYILAAKAAQETLQGTKGTLDVGDKLQRLGQGLNIFQGSEDPNQPAIDAQTKVLQGLQGVTSPTNPGEIDGNRTHSGGGVPLMPGLRKK